MSKKTNQELVQDAIVSLKQGRNKLTIKNIAERANISRKTIYNNPEIRNICNQEIEIQKQQAYSHLNDEEKEKIGIKSGYLNKTKVLEARYLKTKNESADLKRKNDLLLLENNKIVLEKEQLNSKISMLEKKMKRMTDDKVKKLK